MKKYEVIGGLLGYKRGDTFEGNAAQVEASGMLGTKLREIPAASASEKAENKGSPPAPKGDGGQTPNPSPATGSAGPEPVKPVPPPKPPIPPRPPIPPKPVPPANPAGAQAAVKPETKS